MFAAAGAAYWHASPKLAYADRDFTTGYILLGLMIFLAIYNGRKKLSMLPLGKASIWLTLHLAGGILALVIFRLHVGSLWPIGPMHRALAALFYAVCLSGIVGYGLQLWLSRRLAQAGSEIIFERIPAEISAIRAQVEKAVLEAAADSGNDTLGRRLSAKPCLVFRAAALFLEQRDGRFRPPAPRIGISATSRPSAAI